MRMEEEEMKRKLAMKAKQKKIQFTLLDFDLVLFGWNREEWKCLPCATDIVTLFI